MDKNAKICWSLTGFGCSTQPVRIQSVRLHATSLIRTGICTKAHVAAETTVKYTFYIVVGVANYNLENILTVYFKWIY